MSYEIRVSFTSAEILLVQRALAGFDTLRTKAPDWTPAEMRTLDLATGKIDEAAMEARDD